MSSFAKALEKPSPQRKLGARELSELVKSGGVTVVDVRTVTEFRAGHIARAINVPMDEIESRLEDLPAGSPIVMVCQSGNRSLMTRERVQGRLPQAVCLDGGLVAWEAAGLPVVRSVRTHLALDRQSLLGASILILASVALGTFVNPNWYFLALLPGLGLMLAGTTGFCLMGIILATMPWNKVRA